MNRLILFNNSSNVDSGDATKTDPTKITDQEIGIFDADDIAGGTLDLTGANATDRIIISQGDDKYPFSTQVISKDKIKRVIRKDFQDYTNQVTNIGFTGSGSLGLTVSEGDAYAKVTRLERGFEQYPRATSDITVESGDNEYDIANKLAEGFNSLEGSKSFVRAEVLINGSSTQLVDDATTPANVTLDVTEGSKVAIANVTSGADVDASVDDYIRIGHATNLTAPVYQIKAIETNGGAQTELEIELDRAYGSKTEDGVAAGTLDAAVNAEEGGVRITAKDVDEVEGFVESWAAVSFHTAVSPEFDGTTVAIGTTPQTASGTFSQVREIEKAAAGQQSSYVHRNYFPQTPEFFADEDTDYDIIILLVELDNDNAVINQNRYLEIVLAWDSGANIADQISTFFGVS